MKKHFLFLFSIYSSALIAQKTIVYFESNVSSLNLAAMGTLDSLGDFLKDKDCWQVDVQGYCDYTGGDVINKPLSEARADVVYQYIGKHFKNSIRATSAKGNSSSGAASFEDTEAGKAKNRRAEITYKLVEKPAVGVEKKPDVVLEEIKTPDKPDVLEAGIMPENLKVGKLLVLKNLNFVGGTSELLKESEPSLKLLLQILKEHPTMEIEIEGHVCCANDMELSVERAIRVLEYLTANGIKENRLKYKGHGWNKPIASDATESGRIQNRRVEILVLKE